jgi:ABC-2 type transport system permease protein
MLKGGGIGDVAPEYLALTIILVVITTIAVVRYRRTLD